MPTMKKLTGETALLTDSETAELAFGDHRVGGTAATLHDRNRWLHSQDFDAVNV
jgi:hypothetical protein